ncbi:MAG TPA: DUF5686 family protein [Flavobacteriaceae bacterium]|nr:DUF5686 family protein [Flavobacteriaceae bacterium]
MLRLLLLFFIGMSFSLFSQTKVSGVVKDADGYTVPFANVVFENSSEGTTTNENGFFSLESPRRHKTIVVSFMGYVSQKIHLNTSTALNLKIVLEEDAAKLDEVVVYSGKTSKKNNPAIDILRKIWDKKHENGIHKFDQYQYNKYEKLQIDINTIDSAFMKSGLFKNMDFVFDRLDTSTVNGKAFLPFFINEAYSKIYGDNVLKKEKEVLEGNKNSGFSENQSLIAKVKDIYKEYNVYDNYLKFFDKAFTSPLSRTGIDVYNYVLRDSAFIDGKWCYNILYYPRRKSELTFKGDFWVNDSTWAIKKINLTTTKDINVNFVRSIYIDQEFDVLNDSVFVLKRDYFMADLSLIENESAQGINGKRTSLYANYVFNVPKERDFYNPRTEAEEIKTYIKSEEFWESKRIEPLSKSEAGIYKMMDTLETIPRFRTYKKIGESLTTGAYRIKGFEFGPLLSVIGYNEAEKLRIRIGGRTYFGQNDPWRLSGFVAYGFGDDKFKYGISGKILIEPKNRLIIFGENRRDVEQTGAKLTNSDYVVGRNLASSSLFSIGRNHRLTNIQLTAVGIDIEPLKNLRFRITGSFRTMKSATEAFNIDYKVMKDGVFTGEIKSDIRQPEIETAVIYSPGQKTSGIGVDRLIVNEQRFPIFYFSYGYGLKDMLQGDFEYTKLQFFYSQPLNIGGLGRFRSTLELGTTLDPVPLSLLDPIPGNQTIMSTFTTFSQLDYYEFVTDTYISLHLQHDFGGRIFSRIPGWRKLNLREVFGFRAVYGTVSNENRELNASNVPYIAPEDIYWEWSAGIGNIFKFLRVDANFRGNYRELPGARNFGVTILLGFYF